MVHIPWCRCCWCCTATVLPWIQVACEAAAISTIGAEQESQSWWCKFAVQAAPGLADVAWEDDGRWALGGHHASVLSQAIPCM